MFELNRQLATIARTLGRKYLQLTQMKITLHLQTILSEQKGYHFSKFLNYFFN